MLHEEARDLSQHLVAGRPAVLLVELLEVVDVEDDQRQRMPEARVALDLFLAPQRQARLAQPEGLVLEQSLGVVLAELALEEVVLDDRAAEVLTVPQERRARRGPGERSRLGEDAVEQRVQIALVRERDADLDQLRQQLFAIDHGARLSAPRRGFGRCALRRRALDRRPR